MVTNFVVFLVLNLFVVCTAFSELPPMQFEESSDGAFLFYKSPVMQFEKSSDGASLFYESPMMKSEESSDIVPLMRQAASILNVPVPDNWGSLMGPSTSSGFHGQAHVGESTVSNVMANWTIPESFRQAAVSHVRLLVLAATEGTYSVQTISFDTASGTSLTTLLVIAIGIPAPADPEQPVAVMYVTINTKAPIKQLYTTWSERVCERCIDCLGIYKCCCRDRSHQTVRGHTVSELNVVRQKMTADQFIWFNQQQLSPSVVKRSVVSNDNNANEKISLTEAIESFLWDKTAKDEMLASYNDSIITAVQTDLTSLKSSSESLSLNRVLQKNLPKILKALAEDHGFENIYSNPNYSQLLESSRFSYENLFTLQTDVENKAVLIKYIWILGQRIDNSTYTLHFLTVNTTSKNLIETILLNITTDINSSQKINKDKQLNIIRTSTLSGTGEFFNEHLLKWTTPWQQETTRTILNMLRFLSATVLVPQKLRMLSEFDLEMDLPTAYAKETLNYGNGTQSLTDKLVALASSISKVIGSTKDIIQALKSTKSVTIERIVRFGFTYFEQKSETFKVMDIPSSKAKKFIKAVIQDYNLPSKAALKFGLTYSNDLHWDRTEILYSPDGNGRYRYLTIFKNGDSVTDTASFYIVDIDANYNLAPDILLITESSSYFGGLWTSTEASYEERPHIITIDEVSKLQQFFMLVAIGNMATSLGLNTTVPSIN